MNIIISPSKEMTSTDSQQPAIHLYNGLQFRYLRENLTNEDFSFLNQQLHIISAEHGLLRPLDEIGAYRRDFTEKGLYKKWNDQIYQALVKEGRTILNVASDEFSKTITRYATAEDHIVSVSFFEKDSEGNLKKHSTISKKGRGQLVNFIARKRVTNLTDIKSFTDMGYQFSETESGPINWVFIRPKGA